jgi:hypothetical protein
MKRYILICLFLTLAVLGASAQNFSLTGTVSGPSGKAIPNATIVLKNTAYATTCDSVGNYHIINIKAGSSYSLQAYGRRIYYAKPCI